MSLWTRATVRICNTRLESNFKAVKIFRWRINPWWIYRRLKNWSETRLGYLPSLDLSSVVTINFSQAFLSYCIVFLYEFGKCDLKTTIFVKSPSRRFTSSANLFRAIEFARGSVSWNWTPDRATTCSLDRYSHHCLRMKFENEERLSSYLMSASLGTAKLYALPNPVPQQTELDDDRSEKLLSSHLKSPI